MTDSQFTSPPNEVERRQYPRYDVATRLSVAVEDRTLGESIGIAEAGDISRGGLRVRRLPRSSVRTGDRLGILLIGQDQTLPLQASVVHHGADDSFGVQFQALSSSDGLLIDDLIRQLH
jgi:hypothetical protein